MQGYHIADSKGPASSRLKASRILLLGILIPPVGVLFSPDASISSAYFRGQDGPILLALIGALVAMTFAIPPVRLPAWKLGWRHVVSAAAMLVLLLWWGTYAIMADYALTRDEHMVLFDMAVFSNGRLIEPLAPEWRSMLKAIVPAFSLETPGSGGLVSDYLPGNALMRQGFSYLADPALMNPVLLGLSIMALYDICRRLFPDDRTVAVTMLLYAASAQVLVTAMTAFAMTGHTALNLIWLALFLRDKPWAHGLAMFITIWAIGLHQPVFHPLFAGPLLLWRLHQKRYALFAAYTAVFIAGLLFWTSYHSYVAQTVQDGGDGHLGDPADFWRNRVLPLLLNRDSGTTLATVLNLIRFTTWNHLALVPLMFFAYPLVRRNEGPALPLAAGIFATLGFCILVLPFQGHGWGYRYLSGVLGNAVILGGMGYRRWADRDRPAADGLVAGLTAMTALVSIPFLLWSAHGFVAPHVRVAMLVDRQTSDFVLIDTEEPSHAIDQVRNRADLSNRPLVFSSRDMTVGQVVELCRRGSVTLVRRADIKAQGMARNVGPQSPLFEQRIAGIVGQPCIRPLVK